MPVEGRVFVAESLGLQQVSDASTAGFQVAQAPAIIDD